MQSSNVEIQSPPIRKVPQIPSTPVVFMGRNAEVLGRVFPPAVRDIFQEATRVVGPDIPGDAWRDYVDALRECEVIFGTWGFPQIDEEFLSHTPNLKAIFYAAGTVRHFVSDEIFRRKIRLSSAREANAIPVTDYAVSTVLLSLKRFWSHVRPCAPHERWQMCPSVPGAYKTTVGIISLGTVGQQVAERLMAGSELELLAYDPIVSADLADRCGAQLVDLPTLFKRSDVITLHAPWLPETEHLISRSLIESMKVGATLINTARGAIIDESALCEVLAIRSDLTAILDVAHTEPPLPDSPLRSLPNVILTPHISGSMGGEAARMGRWMLDEFLRFHEGKPLRHEITEDLLATMA